MIELAILAIVINLGLVTALAPCLFPVLPSYVTYLFQKDSNLLKGLITSLLVVVGIMTVFILFGFFTNFVATGLIDFFGDNFQLFAIFQGSILIIFGILLVMKISINFTFLTQISGSSQEFLQRFENPYSSSYLIGIFFAILAAPCAILYIFTLFAITAGETLFNTSIYMLAFSLGAGIPFAIIGIGVPLVKLITETQSVSTSSLSQRAHQLNEIIPRIAGVFIILAGLVLINSGFDQNSFTI